MHKRAVQHIPDLSSAFRHAFPRHLSGSSRGGGRAAARRSTKLREREREYDNRPVKVAEELRKVLSPEACGWLEGKPKKGKEGVKGKSPLPVSAFSPSSNSPSQEKQQFLAVENTTDDAFHSTDGDVDALAEETHRIPTGTLVEIRRGPYVIRGVVLYSMLFQRRWVVNVLANFGEVWPCFEHEVTFQLPNFVSRKLAERCGMFELSRSQAESDARVLALNKLRSFEKRFEYDLHTIPEMARLMSFYDQVAHSDPTAWAPITTREAAAKLLGRETTLTTQDLFAVQSFLFASGDHYVAESRRFLQKQLFWVRPRQEVADIEAVTEMVLRDSPVLDSFVEKARRLITESRKRAADSWDEAPSRLPLDGFEWTDEERTIFRFLLASMQDRRFIQTDPFAVPVAHIMKMVGMHSPESYDSAAAHTFLVDLGLRAPWEELNAGDLFTQKETETADLIPTVATPILPTPLGPTDFYSQDVVESLRHDFGDMPAFVIDDWGAEELDDGVSIERIPSDPEHTWLHVHVADPTALLPPTHDIARQAKRLSNSSYFVDRTIPMLPRDAGLDRFSLGSTPGQPNVALTFSAKVNSSGTIVDYKVRPTLIRNIHIIKYDEADAFLGNRINPTSFPFGGEGLKSPQLDPRSVGPAVMNDLQLISKVTQSLGEERCRNNAFGFSFPRPLMTIEPRPLSNDIMGMDIPFQFRGFPKLTYGVTESIETGARGIVAECMKAAGRVASLFFRDRDIPAIRRSVGPVKTELRGKFEELLASRGPGGLIDPYLALATRVTAPAGEYTLLPAMHSLLGVPEGEGYMKVTSPLRRFGDMIAHWQIKHALLAEKGAHASRVLFDADWLLGAAEEISMRELASGRVEGYQQSFWAHSFLLRWMADPRHAQRERDPLRDLKARVTEPPAKYSAQDEVNYAVYLPTLGLKARMVKVPLGAVSPELGDEIDVDIHGIRLGTRPMLDVKAR